MMSKYQIFKTFQRTSKAGKKINIKVGTVREMNDSDPIVKQMLAKKFIRKISEAAELGKPEAPAKKVK
jgi:hypothetical protein